MRVNIFYCILRKNRKRPKLRRLEEGMITDVKTLWRVVKSRGDEGPRELIHHTGLIPWVSPLKFCLEMVPSSPADNVTRALHGRG